MKNANSKKSIEKKRRPGRPATIDHPPLTPSGLRKKIRNDASDKVLLQVYVPADFKEVVLNFAERWKVMPNFVVMAAIERLEERQIKCEKCKKSYPTSATTLYRDVGIIEKTFYPPCGCGVKR